jgi:predicted RNA-binding protein YlqC (UPF0109 family)
MEKLLKFLIENMTSLTDYEIKEEEQDDSTLQFTIVSKPDTIGLIIGKEGKTIKAIQNLLRVKGRLENKSVFVNVSEK